MANPIPEFNNQALDFFLETLIHQKTSSTALRSPKNEESAVFEPVPTGLNKTELNTFYPANLTQ